MRWKMTAVAMMVAALGTFATGPAGAAAGLDRDERAAECRYATADGRLGWSTPDVRKLIRCAVDHWSVPGGFDQAIAVASCESGADLLDSSSDGYTGTFQQSTRYWPGRQDHYDPKSWDRPLPEPASNPRANVVVSIRMAHGPDGWGAWESGRCA